MEFLKVFLILTFSTAFVSSEPIENLDKNLILLIKRKFSLLPDALMDDEYYKPDAAYLRSADRKCVFNKLNLIDNDEISIETLEAFDAKEVFGDLEEDLSTMVIYVMFSCIKDVDGFNRHYFNRLVDKPHHKIPKESTECAKNELMKLKVGKPLVTNFKGLSNHTQEQCDEILFDLKAVNESWDTDFRGCLKVYDSHSLEYSLKFAVMSNERTDSGIFEMELKKYENESFEVCGKFVDCMIEKYFIE